MSHFALQLLDLPTFLQNLSLHLLQQQLSPLGQVVVVAQSHPEHQSYRVSLLVHVILVPQLLHLHQFAVPQTLLLFEGSLVLLHQVQRRLRVYYLHDVLVGAKVVGIAQQFQEGRKVLDGVTLNVDQHSPLAALIVKHFAGDGLSGLVAEGREGEGEVGIGRGGFFEGRVLLGVGEQFFGFEEGFFDAVHEGEVNAIVVQFGGLLRVVGKLVLQRVEEGELSSEGLGAGLLAVLLGLCLLQYFLPVLLQVVFNFLQVGLGPLLDFDQVIFDALQVVFGPEQVSFQGSQQVADSGVLFLVNEGHRLEVVVLVCAEHFALAASRPFAILAVVVQTDSMLSAPARLLFMVQQG